MSQARLRSAVSMVAIATTLGVLAVFSWSTSQPPRSRIAATSSPDRPIGDQGSGSQHHDGSHGAGSGDQSDHDHDPAACGRGTQVAGGWTCRIGDAYLFSRVPFDTRPTAADERAARAFVERTEAAVAPYRDVGRARAAGYTWNDRVDYLEMVAGTPRATDLRKALRHGVVTHLVNPRLANDGVAIDPARPDALMYATDGTTYVLVGVMYIAPAGTHGPAVAGPLAPWHAHEDLNAACWDGSAPVAYPDPTAGGRCAAGRRVDRSPEMLHVWFDSATLASTFSAHMSPDEAAERVLARR